MADTFRILPHVATLACAYDVAVVVSLFTAGTLRWLEPLKRKAEAPHTKR